MNHSTFPNHQSSQVRHLKSSTSNYLHLIDDVIPPPVDPRMQYDETPVPENLSEPTAFSPSSSLWRNRNNRVPFPHAVVWAAKSVLRKGDIRKIDNRRATRLEAEAGLAPVPPLSVVAVVMLVYEAEIRWEGWKVVVRGDRTGWCCWSAGESIGGWDGSASGPLQASAWS